MRFPAGSAGLEPQGEEVAQGVALREFAGGAGLLLEGFELLLYLLAGGAVDGAPLAPDHEGALPAPVGALR
ncbi:MAG: hypothetical protein HY689_02585 [Chloroflexi bacterium]|nr:hypothetical protein [Chloroflexota bacterium]